MTDETKRRPISYEALARARTPAAPAPNPWHLPKALPGVEPEPGLAMDSLDPGLGSMLGYAADSYTQTRAVHFPGFPFLAELSLIVEHRRPAVVVAQEAMRKGFKLVSNGTGDVSDRIKQLEDGLEKFKARKVLHDAILQDQQFGGSYIFLDVGNSADDPAELRTPLSLTPEKIGKGAMTAIRVTDSMWVYPGPYNSTNPLRADFYKPSHWNCMGAQVHRSRLIQVVSREVPNLLKPVFMFNGISAAQLAMPAVKHYIEVRTEVLALLKSFNVPVLSSNLSATLGGDSGEDLFARIDLFNATRTNRGCLVIDKDTEAFTQVSTTLAGIREILDQALEQLSAATGIPKNKLLGIEPSGLGADSDATLQCFYDSIAALQHIYDEALKTILHALQLHLFGDIDSSITAEWLPLEEDSEQDLANNRKIDADAAKVLIDAGVISPAEERERLKSATDGVYGFIDLSVEIEADPAAEAPPGPEDDEPDEKVVPGEK